MAIARFLEVKTHAVATTNISLTGLSADVSTTSQSTRPAGDVDTRRRAVRTRETIWRLFGCCCRVDPPNTSERRTGLTRHDGRPHARGPKYGDSDLAVRLSDEPITIGNTDINLPAPTAIRRDDWLHT
jgi:hypothetical protein